MAATTRAATKKTATTKKKKAATKKAATTRTATKKVATTKAATKKAATKKAATTKAATKKTATKERATKKATTKKVATKTAATTKAATKKAATKKAATKKAAPTPAVRASATTTRASSVPPVVPTQSPPRAPYTAIRDRRIGNSTSFGFYRHGCFVLAGNRALWGRPGKHRVGWLSLDDGAFEELFVCDAYANWVGTDGVIAIGTSKSQFVVLDPAKGKKPLRYPGASDYCRQVVVTPTHVLTLQNHATKKQDLHVFNRQTFKLEKVSGDSSAYATANGTASEISLSGHAAFYLEGKNIVNVWAAPYDKPTSLPLPAVTGKDPMGRSGVRAMGLSSDGARVALLSIDAVYVVDVGTGEVVKISAPSPRGTMMDESVRDHVYARSWVRPLPNNQVLVLDKVHWGYLYDEAADDSHDRIEVVATIYDVATGAVRAVHHAALRSDTDHSLGETIAIDDERVLLNASRILEFA